MKQSLHIVFKYIMCLLGGLLLEYQGAVAQSNCGCDHIITPDQLFIDGGQIGAKPGDVVCVMASSKRYLGFVNFHGAPGKPIIFINCGGQVVIKDTDWYYGMKFDNCSFFKVTGTGSVDYKYGFLIDGTPPQITGLGISKMSTDFEVEYIEISRTGFAGIMAKSDPDCTGEPNRGNFVQRNTIIHHNYIHDTGGEGLYIGFPHYRGVPRFCPEGTKQALPHELVGVRIYNNTIYSTGREGIQLGCAVEDVEVYNNEVRNYGTKNGQWQRSGVHFSTGTVCKFYSNLVSGGTGAGIELNGKGDNYIYNNLILNTGTSGEDGIMLVDSIVDDGKGYHIINNTIVNSGGMGVKTYTDRATIITFANNIIAGTPEFYYLNPAAVPTIANNLYAKDPGEIHFEDYANENFHLKATSPAVDGGADMKRYGVVNDYEYIERPRKEAYDIGAYESPYERMMIGFFVYPNPVYIDKITHTHVKFVLPDDTDGSLLVYDVYGRVVSVIARGPFKGAQRYEYILAPPYLAQGIYYYTLETSQGRQVIKVLIAD